MIAGTMQQLQYIFGQLRLGRPNEARRLGELFTRDHPEIIDGWLLLGRACADLKDYPAAIAAAEKASAINAAHPGVGLFLLEVQTESGQFAKAASLAAEMEKARASDPVTLLQIARCHSRAGRYEDAARTFARLHALKPEDGMVSRDYAAAHMAMGDMDKADALLAKAIASGRYEAWYMRATLRRQTGERNHIEALEAARKAVPEGSPADAALSFALAKELEDLGEWRRAFANLKHGADALKRLRPMPDTILPMIELLRRHIADAFFAAPPPGHAEESPIFVVGMPRSGTTLVDRILSSHSTVTSVGESGQFGRLLSASLDGGKLRGVMDDSIRRLDFAAIGRGYGETVHELKPNAQRLLDKTPYNFIYLGLILTALPNAKIVHLRRNPMDSCYAYYKTLFIDGEPCSNDLHDVARHYLGYRNIMAHWRRLLPGRFLDVDYEDLVETQEAVSRRMADFCGLDWEDACLSFEKNASVSLTASASQVRRPIYKTSVGLWRRYEEELQPLAQALRQGGIDIDAPPADQK